MRDRHVCRRKEEHETKTRSGLQNRQLLVHAAGKRGAPHGRGVQQDRDGRGRDRLQRRLRPEGRLLSDGASSSMAPLLLLGHRAREGPRAALAGRARAGAAHSGAASLARPAHGVDPRALLLPDCARPGGAARGAGARLAPGPRPAALAAERCRQHLRGQLRLHRDRCHARPRGGAARAERDRRPGPLHARGRGVRGGRQPRGDHLHRPGEGDRERAAPVAPLLRPGRVAPLCHHPRGRPRGHHRPLHLPGHAAERDAGMPPGMLRVRPALPRAPRPALARGAPRAALVPQPARVLGGELAAALEPQGLRGGRVPLGRRALLDTPGGRRGAEARRAFGALEVQAGRAARKVPFARIHRPSSFGRKGSERRRGHPRQDLASASACGHLSRAIGDRDFCHARTRSSRSRRASCGSGLPDRWRAALACRQLNALEQEGAHQRSGGARRCAHAPSRPQARRLAWASRAWPGRQLRRHPRLGQGPLFEARHVPGPPAGLRARPAQRCRVLLALVAF